ncbi:MAG: hypothetical protein OEW87_15805 [Flavobacteriaceae bacterium]|nr:hypothetical protein [Flavobacteriaceae bacterium]
METNYLLPHKYKNFGWALFILGLLAGIVLIFSDYEVDALNINVISIYSEPFMNNDNGYFKIIENSIVDEIIALFIIIGGLLVGFSKEKVEDEFIYKLRKDSLVWAIIFNYAVLMLAIAFVYEFTFFHVLVFNMFTPLLFFVFRFNFLKYRSISNEE